MNWAVLVRSRQSTQLVLNTPVWNKRDALLGTVYVRRGLCFFMDCEKSAPIRNDLKVSQTLIGLIQDVCGCRNGTKSTQMEKKPKQTWMRPLAVTCPPRSPHLKHSTQIKKPWCLVGAHCQHCNHILHINAEKLRGQEWGLSFGFVCFFKHFFIAVVCGSKKKWAW